MGLGAPGAHGDANRCFRGGWPHGGYAKRACAEKSEEDLEMSLGDGGAGGEWRLETQGGGDNEKKVEGKSESEV